jgi:hypothetical protein
MGHVIAIETGVGWRLGRERGIWRWVFPAPAVRDLVKAIPPGVHNLNGEEDTTTEPTIRPPLCPCRGT